MYPGEVEFLGVQEGVQYEHLLRVRNLTGRSGRVRISEFPKYSYFHAQLQSLNAVAPNLYVDILVTFHFRSHEIMPNTLLDGLTVKLEGQLSPKGYRVKLKATRAAHQID